MPWRRGEDTLARLDGCRLCIYICGCVFSIRFARGAVADLDELDAHVRSRILLAIENRLVGEPLRPSRNRKQLVGLLPAWEQVRPVWELRVGEHRVFYDADPVAHTVVVQAVRQKGRRMTREIL